MHARTALLPPVAEELSAKREGASASAPTPWHHNCPPPNALQPVFDRVVKHLRAQGERSLRYRASASKCAYRGLAGQMCAVGCLIPDELYNEELEAWDVYELLCQGKLDGMRYSHRGHKLLDHLQSAHDNHLPHEWEYRFVLIAEDFGLQVPA